MKPYNKHTNEKRCLWEREWEEQSDREELKRRIIFYDTILRSRHRRIFTLSTHFVCQNGSNTKAANRQLLFSGWGKSNWLIDTNTHTHTVEDTITHKWVNNSVYPENANSTEIGWEAMARTCRAWVIYLLDYNERWPHTTKKGALILFGH